MAATGTDAVRSAPGIVDRFICDPRDVEHLKLIAQCTSMPLAAAGLFYLGTFSWWLAVVYWAVLGLGLIDRYTLMLHCVSHRPLFKKRFRIMNHYVPVFLGPFFGQSPHTYFCHHMGMHHSEGNMPNDLSSTMKYQRDNLFHWLRYFCRFFFLCMIELPLYLYRRGRFRLARRAFFGELGWLTAMGLGLYFMPQPTFVVFVAPFLLMRFLMMAGNWGQHAFVDPDEPDNDFKSSITCLAGRYNRRCFNDGYHIVHHRKPTLHFSEMAEEFEANRPLYGEEDAIVFEHLDFFMVWALLMAHQYKLLAKCFVQLPGAPERSQEEVIALLKRRLARFDVARFASSTVGSGSA